MRRVIQPLIPLHCETGASIDDAWMSELATLNLTRRPRKGRLRFGADLRWWFCEKHHDGMLLEAVQDVDLSLIFPDGIRAAPPPLPVPSTPGVEVEETWSGDPIHYAHGGYPGTIHRITLHTAKGSVSGIERYADRSFGVTEHAIKRPEDLAIVGEVYERRAAAMGTDSAGNGVMPMVAFQSFLIQWAGVAEGVFIFMDAQEEVQRLVARVEQIYEPIIEALARQHPWICSCENLSADISTPYWDRFVGPQLARRAELAGRFGAQWEIHLDGVVQPLLGRVAATGVRAVNGLTASPSGDLDPLKFREVAGPQLVLKDILPQIIFVPMAYSEEDFENYVRRVIECYRDDERIVLGIGDMLPANGSLKRVARVIELIEELTA